MPAPARARSRALGSPSWHAGGVGTDDAPWLTADQFEQAVADALDSIPEELGKLMRNVAVLVEEEPPVGDPHLLGIYEGTPLTERDGWWDAGSMPDRITIFQGPLTRMCVDRTELLEEIAVTVVHEVAHHFGITDERLHELGWE